MWFERPSLYNTLCGTPFIVQYTPKYSFIFGVYCTMKGVQKINNKVPHNLFFVSLITRHVLTILPFLKICFSFTLDTLNKKRKYSYYLTIIH